MCAETYKRKLTAIFSTDVKGYSRLMGADELATVETLKQYRRVITEFIHNYQGRVIDSPGDNLLAEFASVVDAANCALDIQEELKNRNADVPEDRRMEFRIGVNLGDVIQDNERIYGDGVNIAARLEGLANAGEVWISGMAYDQVKSKLSVGYEYQGRKEVKNIRDPIRVYRLLTDPKVSGKTIYKRKRYDPRHRRKMAVILTVLTGVALAAAFVAFKLYFHGTEGPLKNAIARHRRGAVSAQLPAIAVLPFVNMSGDAEQEYFADGFTEDLITDLSKIAGLRVISRNSVFSYKGKTVKIAQVGRRFDVGYVLEGSVRKAGEKVRINAQLIDVKTVDHVWAERYDRNLKDIFNVQDEVSRKIVAALALKLTAGEEERLLKKATDNLEAYDVYLRGMEYYARFSKHYNEKARELFKRAIQMDPRFVDAHAYLGWTYFNDWAMAWSPDPQVLDRAHEAAEVCLSQDANAPKALCLLGSVLLWKKRHDEAIAAYEKSLALDPNYAEALSGMGDALVWAGRPEEGIPLILEAISLNPGHEAYYQFYLGHAYFLIHRYSQAIEALQKSLNRNPDFFPSRIILAAVYGEMDQIVFGQDEMKEVMRYAPDGSMEEMRQKLPYKDPAVLKRVLEALAKLDID